VDIKTEEQKVLINELRRYDKLQFMDKIISSIAHEIRNPLTSIKLYTTQMKDKLKDEEFILAAAEDIPDEIERIDGLIKEFMEYTSPRKAVIENSNLYEELMKTIKLVKFHLGNIDLLIDVDKSYYIKFDTGHFKQIVLNILLNSIDAVKEVSHPTIRIKATINNDKITLSFNDNGHGMNENDIQYIFEPFYTTKEYGNGIGMFVVKQLVDENEGMIHASSHGKGMGMSIILEVKRGEYNEE
jgi:nitrogen fixation/metabolism regulation signal transduction histidine kinase